jgi:hypothetical protein
VKKGTVLSMGNLNTTLLILVCLVMGIVFLILILALIREGLFWYWRTKGILNEPRDILNQNHETALIIRKSIDGLRAAESAAKSSGIKSLPSRKPGKPDRTT